MLTVGMHSGFNPYVRQSTHMAKQARATLVNSGGDHLSLINLFQSYCEGSFRISREELSRPEILIFFFSSLTKFTPMLVKSGVFRNAFRTV